MNFKVLLCIATVLILSASNIFAQAQNLSLNIECDNQVVNNNKCFKFTASEVDELEAIQFTVTYDPTVLKLVGAPIVNTSCLTNLVVGDFNFSTPGVISILWQNDGKNISNNCELFTLCFDFIGLPGECSDVSINSLFTEIEATSSLGPVKVTTTACKACVLPNQRTTVAKFCNPSAKTEKDGTICFYGIGGTGPYNYSIKSNTTGSIIPNGTGTCNDKEEICISGLGEDTYIITIVDVGGIVFTPKNVIMIDAGTNPKFDIAFKKPSCFNKNNGTIKLSNFNVASLNYKIEWSNGVFNLDSLDYLMPGIYKASVIDENGCKVTKTADLRVDTLKLDYQIIAKGKCLGSKDAEIKITASGGTPYPDGSYDFYKGTGFVKFPNPYIDLNATTGWVNLKIRDNAKNFIGNIDPCIVEKLVFIPYRDSIKYNNLQINDIECKGKDFGKVSFTPSGTGTTYSLFRQFNLSTNSALKPTFVAGPSNFFFNDSLKAGKYYVVLKAAECMDTLKFQIKEPQTVFVVKAIVDQPSCTALGSIKITTSGGLPPYTIKWNDFSMLNEKSNLAPGKYSITVSDALKCDTVFNIELLNSANALADAVVQKAITCKDAANGEVTVNTKPGTNIKFEWKDKTGKTYSTQTITNAGPNVYYVTVTNDGCVATDSVILVNPEGLVIKDVIITKPECPKGGAKGSIGLSISGGAPSYKFEWKKQGANTVLSTQSVLPSIDAGTYSVKIIDQAGCTKDTTIILTSPNAFQIDISNLQGVSCFGEKDGKANAKASLGPINNGKYTFFWSNGQKSTGLFDKDVNFTLTAGKNWVFVTDTKCVSDTLFFDVENKPKIIASTITSGLCGGNCVAQIEVVTASSNLVTWPSLNQSGNVVYNLCPGTYQYQVLDVNGCILKDSSVVSPSDTIKLLINNDLSEFISCRKSIGTLVVNVLGGKGPYSYKWQGSNSTTNTAKDLSEGVYTVSVTDVNGCSGELTYTLDRPNPIVADIKEPDQPLCFGGTSCIKVLNVSGGVGNYSMQINNGFRIPIDSCQQLFSGKYLISIYDGAGCKTDYPIIIPDKEKIDLDLGEDINLTLGDSIKNLSPIINSQFTIIDYQWMGLGDLFCIDMECLSITGIPKNDLTVSLIITDENGCTAIDEVNIKVSDIRNVFLPNIFKITSSIEDNKLFDIVVGSGVEIVESFNIFDRWGNLVHTKENYMPDRTSGWDGNLGGQAALPGVYVFRAKVKFIDSTSKTYFGDVMLLK